MKKTINLLGATVIFACVASAVVFLINDLWLFRDGDWDPERFAVGRQLWYLWSADWNRRVVFPLAGAAAALLALAISNRQAVRETVASRRFAFGVLVVIALVAALALAVFVNLSSAKRYQRIDVTYGGIYSLSERTKDILSKLDREVEAHVFLSPYTGGSDWSSTVTQLFDQMKSFAPGKLRVEHYSITRNPEQGKARLKDLGSDPDKLATLDLVVFRSAGRTKEVLATDLFDWENVQSGLGGADRRIRAFKGEEKFLEAILNVVEERQKTVYFLEGHGEPSIHSGQRDGHSIVADTLRRSNFKVETVKLGADAAATPPPGEGSDGPDLTAVTAPKVPADCDVLVIAGPEQPLAELERQAIRDYLGRGGRVLLLAAPTIGEDPQTGAPRFVDLGVNEAIAGFGIKVDDALLDDPAARPLTVRLTERGLVRDPFKFAIPLENVEFRHEVMKPLEGTQVELQQPTVLEIEPATPGVPGLPDARMLVESSDRGVAIRDIAAFARSGGRTVSREKDRFGRLPVAACATKKVGEAEARLLVVGDGTFIWNEHVRAHQNLDLAVNAVAWLAGDEKRISIGAKPPQIVTLSLDEDQWTRLYLICLLGMPIGSLLLGGLIWFVRRS